MKAFPLFLLSITSVSAFTPTASKSKESSTALSMGLKSSALKTVSHIGVPATAAIAGAAVIGTLGVKTVLDRPSRKYEEGSVAREYDAWTRDGILEYYWGEHIHLGYYNKEE
jgi:MPBQ/MSBQ methyltransferase